MAYNDKGVGYRETDTSEAAAEDVTGKVENLRFRCMKLLRDTGVPMTADEIADALGVNFMSIRPRLTELRNAEKVKDSGLRRKSRFGKSAIAWEASS